MQQNLIQRVRDACEACHARKQRCRLPEPGGPCQACRESSRRCFFVPRLKAGRPRRGRASADHEIQALIRMTPITYLRDASAQLESMPHRLESGSDGETRELSLYSGDQSFQPLQAPNMDMSGPEQMSPHPDNLDGLEGYFDPNLHPDPGFSNSSPSTAQSGTPESALTPPWSADTCVSAKHQPMDMLPPSDPIPLLLQRFAELHQLSGMLSRYTSVASGTAIPHGFFHPITSALDTICTHMLTITDSYAASSDYPADVASTTIMLGLLLKVMSLCEALITLGEHQLTAVGTTCSPADSQLDSVEHHSKHQRPAVQRVDSGYRPTPSKAAYNTETEMAVILMLKQVDLHITQTRVSLSRMTRHREHCDPNMVDEKTSTLYRRIRVLIDMTYR